MAQLESKQLNKIGLHENVTNRNMDEKLLLKCENSIRRLQNCEFAQQA